LIKCKPPDNWWVKVGDLGLSKRAESDMASTTIRGTENFMAPEVRGFPFTGDPMLANPFAADMWALGEIVFRALSGRATFENPQALSDYQKNEP
jgi:serine/threonine protein kinase